MSGLSSDTFSAAPDQLSSRLGAEVVILSLHSGVYYGLDPVGSRIWELLQESRTLPAIRDQIVQEFDVAPEQCEQDLLALIKQMEQEGLIQVNRPR